MLPQDDVQLHHFFGMQPQVRLLKIVVLYSTDAFT